MARTNGGIIGKRNVTSFGKNIITDITSTGCHALQTGTRIVKTVLVGGGGGGGINAGGGGGGGGLILSPSSVSVCGNVAYPIVIGSGGSDGPSPAPGNDTTGFGLTAKGGGAGGCNSPPGAAGGSGGGGGGGGGSSPTTGGAATQPC